MWDLIVSVPDHSLYFYYVFSQFTSLLENMANNFDRVYFLERKDRFLISNILLVSVDIKLHSQETLTKEINICINVYVYVT